MLLLPEGQTGETWEPSKKNAVSEISERWEEKYFHFVSVFKVLSSKDLSDVNTFGNEQPVHGKSIVQSNPLNTLI